MFPKMQVWLYYFVLHVFVLLYRTKQCSSNLLAAMHLVKGPYTCITLRFVVMLVYPLMSATTRHNPLLHFELKLIKLNCDTDCSHA